MGKVCYYGECNRIVGRLRDVEECLFERRDEVTPQSEQ